ncbi:hypothetical protein BDZ90DRAFT_262661 [Jaminaea rosea]|uniref:Uncharacterized protein n=1 Tax=Jaminaea rosea TaxID=1569628 RepID=A0A316UJV3_9BASI|nr:hypothetical protein BDZ90DRAFT_262661 [Jaminaea rosea]PWN25214.1 hypothetical protein BDZ90DRAFT_262661 [Jaminaea rosea]
MAMDLAHPAAPSVDDSIKAFKQCLDQSGLVITDPDDIEPGCWPQQYRSAVLSWLRQADALVHTAFFLYVGIKIRVNDGRKAKRAVEKVVKDLYLVAQCPLVCRVLAIPFQGVPVRPLRLASAFPDILCAFQGMVSNKATTTISLFNRADSFTMPAILTLSQSLQLDLDSEMQMYANQYNRHHWLGIMWSAAEVPGCGNFLSQYFDYGRANRYRLFFPLSMFTTDAWVSSTLLFKPPYDFRQLVAYGRLVSRFFSGQGTLGVGDINKAFEHIDFSGLTPLDSVACTFEDERRDGAVPRIQSKDPKYREAKKTALREKGRLLQDDTRSRAPEAPLNLECTLV